MKTKAQFIGIYLILIALILGNTYLFIKQRQIIRDRYTAITIGPPDGGLGDNLYTAFTKVNSNFSAIDDSLEVHLDSINDHRSTLGELQVLLADTVDLEDVFLLQHPEVNSQTGTTYTLVLDDDGKVITCTNSSAITVTVPPNSSVAFPVGTQVTLIAIGAGQVTIAAGSGVTINSAGGALKLRVQYSAGTLLKTGTDTWILFGDITAS